MNKEKKKEDDKALIEKLNGYFDTCRSHYSKVHKKMKLLDATDSGELWKALNAKFPHYQILPDTNFVSYIKSNLLASIYTVTKGADIQPTSEKDKDLIVNLNVAMERIWKLSNVGYYQFQAGERAALLNMGITQVGWSESIVGGSGDAFIKGNIVLKNINPMKFMRDPFATSLDTSSYCMTYDKFHKSFFMENSLYKEEFKIYEEKQKGTGPKDIPEPDKPNAGADKDYYTLVTFWVKDDNGNINEYHTINAEHILYRKINIKPSIFPFAILYCNEPNEKLVGTSEPAKIFANNVAYNLMNSISLTAEYKNQRPPKFISNQSGLNIQAFAKHGDEADRTFIVNGKAQDAVYYHQFPNTSAQLPSIMDRLQGGIEGVTGVDGKYTGRNSGSITTTGGMEELMSRVTVIDTPKIMLYEAYTKRLTHLILSNFIQFCPKRKYFYRKPDSTKWDTTEIDFPKIDNETLFDYEINISSELPDNKQRIAQTANELMEKQMQYRKEGASVELITEEEWLMFQDLPNKEYMLERMGVQRMNDTVSQVAQTLFQYADLVKNGMNPNDAILATANTLKQTQQGIPPEMGPVPAAMMDSQMPEIGDTLQ